MKKDSELATRLQEIYRRVYKNSATVDREWWDAMKDFENVIHELNPPMFPDPIDGIKIERVTYFPGCAPADAAKERRFAISKTEPCKPYEATDMRTGEKKIYNTNTYVIANLEWNEKEDSFDFNGVGTRWLEAAPSKEVCDMILKFCNKMTKEYEEEDGYEE